MDGRGTLLSTLTDGALDVFMPRRRRRSSERDAVARR